MQQRRMGRTGLKVSEICLGTMTFAGQCDEATSIADPGRGDRAGRHVPRHGRRLPDPARRRDGGPDRGGHRPLAGRGAGPSRRARPGDEVPDPGRPRAQRPGALAPAHPRRLRGEPPPAPDRLHRPLPGPHARPRDADRRDPARLRRPGPLGQGPLRRLLELPGLAARAGARGERAARLGAVSTASSRGTTCSTARSRPSCCRSAATRGSA